MSSAIVITALILLLFSMLAGTATLALRDLSHHKVAELLEARGKREWLRAITRDMNSLILVASFLRHCTNILYILCTTEMFRDVYAVSVPQYALQVLLVGGVGILLFGVTIPHAWARYAGESYVVGTFPILNASRILLRPVVAVMHAVDSVVRRLAGAPLQDAETQADEAEREILDAVSEGERYGVVDEEEKEMIESVIELRDKHVGEIMTPRTQVVALEVSAGIEQVRELILKEGHSRLPVYKETIDNVLGVLYVKDLLALDSQERINLREIMREVPFIPETKSLRDLLHQFQESKVHMALVLDEYGGTAGLITIEDILEELVGEIVDEYEPPEPEPIVRVDEHTVDVDALVRIDELNDEIGVELPEDEDYETVGGFVFSTLGRIPAAGEAFTHKRVHIAVIQAEERKINRLRIRALGDEDVQESGPPDS